MKTFSIVTAILLPTTVLGAACTADDLAAISDPLTKCMLSANGTTINPLVASATDISQLCKIDACKTAFKMLYSLTCAITDDNVRQSFNCASSSGNIALVSGVALIMASFLAMAF
ncbi:unnamed protein product [Aphanomyces euteiches]|nr:hypothetical protein Ae201684P_003300 [Aphanomyces euteiches]KAH9148997.1 hypothetical protein AeRB84_007810 [Aphanomyces euteiches]